MVWHLLQRIPGYLPESFVNAAMALNKVELGVSTTFPRWQRCLSKAQSAFGFTSAALYVDKTFPPESKAKVRGSFEKGKVFLFFFFFPLWGEVGREGGEQGLRRMVSSGQRVVLFFVSHSLCATYMFVCEHAYICVCVHLYVYVCMLAYVYVCMLAYICVSSYQ